MPPASFLQEADDLKFVWRTWTLFSRASALPSCVPPAEQHGEECASPESDGPRQRYFKNSFWFPSSSFLFLFSLLDIPGACVHAQSFQLCPIPSDPVDYSPPGSPVHGILQARILEWTAMPSSRGSSQSRDLTCVSYVSFTDWLASSLPLGPPGKPHKLNRYFIYWVLRE